MKKGQAKINPNLLRFVVLFGLGLTVAVWPPQEGYGQHVISEKVYRDSVDYYRTNTNNYWKLIIKYQKQMP